MYVLVYVMVVVIGGGEVEVVDVVVVGIGLVVGLWGSFGLLLECVCCWVFF